uniref:Uncharacterized protein n=1 Tax=Setaria viridis TaxID=4556 RepID=A0A4U6WA70_SETVI|nr:hypothetical protein SEVIR_1G191066v2 [Setaria viridis]
MKSGKRPMFTVPAGRRGGLLSNRTRKEPNRTEPTPTNHSRASPRLALASPALRRHPCSSSVAGNAPPAPVYESPPPPPPPDPPRWARLSGKIAFHHPPNPDAILTMWASFGLKAFCLTI